MSLREKYLAGWGFRTNKPSFEAGEEISAFVTGHDGDAPVVRIGDTILRVEGAPGDALDTRVRLRVDEFDDNDHHGTATYLETVGQSSF
ncbi:hypothetical protein [Halorussus sp. MSC15.2]|uniref:DUF7513 family protein n=1 Tax=Halorussus sp. MSC15.2 TaxID=2283638 RepID=UPI0013D30FD1|nr:hypothetical protein [Halorussus sp. MSC15.2]NEU57560.1 hypothetical protein [Halorussus sp. MSC15.2]